MVSVIRKRPSGAEARPLMRLFTAVRAEALTYQSCPFKTPFLQPVVSLTLRERGADVAEHRGDCRGNRVYASDGSQGNEANHEGVFDQILALFAIYEVLKLDVQAANCLVHWILPSIS
jgi:hypothetical protein